MQQRMRAGFLDLARAAPDRIVVIDGAGREDAVAEEVARVVASRLT
jgi:dTMP kinase